MIVSAHQPAFLPWLGYFDRIARSDVFVFLDDVQFEKNSFTNRNRIKTDKGLAWLTIPVKHKGHISRTMLSTEISDESPWRRKHLGTIAQAYRQAAHFQETFSRLENAYKIEESNLAALCHAQLTLWLAALAIPTRVVRMSELGLSEKKSDLVLELCKSLDATKYISGALGRNYLELEKFAAASIAVEFQDYAHPVYRQLHGAFVPNLSIVDAWMNVGTKTADFFRKP